MAVEHRERRGEWRERERAGQCVALQWTFGVQCCLPMETTRRREREGRGRGGGGAPVVEAVASAWVSGGEGERERKWMNYGGKAVASERV